ncbi:MAG: fructose PTS transporter subunit IIB, partial [Eubacterium sp.]
MRISDLLKKEGIDLNGPSASKAKTIDILVDLMAATGNLKDKEVYKKAVLDREAQGTTGVGEGIAIPHGKSPAVLRAGLAAMVCKNGTDYDAMDGQPVYLIFMIAVPDNSDDTHLELLSRLSMMLMDEDFRNTLINAANKDEFLKLIDTKEREKFAEDEREAVADVDAEAAAEIDAGGESPKSGPYDIVAVTACPTGIAHTYMAAEALEEKAKKMGVRIKVETNGSGGVKNALTPEDIAGAKGVIVAADKKVAMARFAGKPVLQTKVSDGINKTQDLIEKAMAGDLPIFQ